MTPHADIRVRALIDVADACRVAARVAADCGADAAVQGRLETIVTALGCGLAQSSATGRLLLHCRADAGRSAIEILALDNGRTPTDRSGGGIDLQAVECGSSEFSMFCIPGRGRVVLSRLWTKSSEESGPGWFTHAGICLAAPREMVSGDAWGVRIDGPRVSLMVADGLGHGLGAARASGEAVKMLSMTTGSPGRVLELAHHALRGTVGAAISVAEIESGRDTIVFAGAGNVSCRLISGLEDRTLLAHDGTVGIRIRRQKDEVLSWPAHAALILHSDGLTSRWKLADAPGLLQCDPAVIAGWLVLEHTRGNDDSTVVVLKRR